MTTTTMTTLTRPAEFLLIRLLAPTRRPTPPSRLRQDMDRLLRSPLDSDGWQSLLEELTGAGLATDRPLRLTEAGRAEALELLGIQHLPPRATWPVLRDRYLVPRALGLTDAEAEIKSRIRNLDGLAALLLRRRYDLPDSAGNTARAVMEALVCRELGYPDEKKFSALRDRILNRLLDAPTPLKWKDLAEQMPRAVAGASRGGAVGLREAVLRDWLSPAGSEPALEADGQPPEVRHEPEPFDLSAFAATVKAAARSCPTGRFGDDKVFIHHVWNQLRGEIQLPVHSLEEFKERLGEANHAGLIHLSRADLVQAMDPEDVRQSETRYLDAVFHFIRTEGGRP